MATIDINKVKTEAVHTGLLEVMITLKEARDKLNNVTEEEEIKQYTKGCRNLVLISETLCEFSNEISEVMSLFFAERVDAELDKQSMK